jgi:hypothetical protein
LAYRKLTIRSEVVATSNSAHDIQAFTIFESHRSALLRVFDARCRKLKMKWALSVVRASNSNVKRETWIKSDRVFDIDRSVRMTNVT